MLKKFELAETESFSSKILKKDFIKKYTKIVNYVYPQLRYNPFFGPNIKKLKGEFEGIYRYRIGSFRLFYTIDNEKAIVFILDILKRKDSYK